MVLTPTEGPLIYPPGGTPSLGSSGAGCAVAHTVYAHNQHWLSPTLSSEAGSFQNLEHTNWLSCLAKLSWDLPVSACSLFPALWSQVGPATPSFYVGSWDVNPGPQACEQAHYPLSSL